MNVHKKLIDAFVRVLYFAEVRMELLGGVTRIKNMIFFFIKTFIYIREYQDSDQMHLSIIFFKLILKQIPNLDAL